MAQSFGYFLVLHELFKVSLRSLSTPDAGLHPEPQIALPAGYSVFTMDLVHGHYLGERRATQPNRYVECRDCDLQCRISYKLMSPRVFKYADKVIADTN